MNTIATLDQVSGTGRSQGFIATANRFNGFLQRNQVYLTLALTAVFVLVMLVMPEMAMAQNIIDEKADTALEWIKRGVYFILVVAVMGSGVLAAFGRMSWATVGQVLIGAIIAGIATAVVDALYGG